MLLLQEFGKIENNLEFKGEIPFYKYIMSDKGGLEEFSKLKNIFPSLEYAPTVYYIENGKIKNELIIKQQEKYEEEIREWFKKLNMI